MKAHVILVIEDNPVTRKLVRLTLGNEGFTVIEAGDAATGLAQASTTPPALILQDLMLPDMDGFELVSRLRGLPEVAAVPIVAFSGFLSRLEHGRAAAAGFTDFLPKPVEPSRLLHVVRAHLLSDLPVSAQVGTGQRVLVVDDDPVQLKLARIRLAGVGLSIVTATDGAEALEVLQRDQVDAVVSDVLMPRLDGFGLCMAMRQDARLAQVPIVLVSSNYVEEADQRLARKMGAAAFVVRTPELTGVIDALRTVLKTPPPAALARTDPTEHHEHHERVVRQLERQAALNAAFAHQSAMHASMLSVVAGISESLTKHHTVEGAGPDILASLLEASGVSMGALFMAAGGDLVLSAYLGFSAAAAEEAERFFGHRDLFERAVAGKSPVVVSSAHEGSGQRDFATRAGMTSGLLVPCIAGDECLALFLLASKGRDLTEADWIPFARTIAVQMGQAFCLSRAFSRLEREVLERTQAEAAARVERDRAQRYLDTPDVILLALDMDARVTLINRYGCALLGFTAAELLGRNWFEAAMPPRLGMALRKEFDRLLHDKPFVVEYPILTRSGEERLIEWRNTLLKDDAGRVIGTFSSGADVTERHQAVEALRTAEERMRFALTNADVGIWDMDYKTGVLRWSAIIEAHYGLQPGTFGGTFEAFLERVHPDDRAALLDTVGQAMRSGADFSVLNRSVWPDGTVRWLSGAGRVLLGEHGEPVRAVGISQDVTARKQAEIEFQRLNDELHLQRMRVFKATMTTVQDIVNNLLNGFQLVRLETEGQLPDELLSLFDQMIEEASVKLKALGDLEIVKEREMAIGLGIDYPGASS